MAKTLPWLGRLQRFFSREAAFLPKRLVLVTLLLLLIYLVLLIRTDQQIRHTALGFVEANLQSKLVADYEQAAKPPAPLAPLRLEILRAKLQDENPTWSEAEVDRALQRALAAAAAPILQATPTPYPTTRMIVQADAVVNEQWVFTNPTSVGAIHPASQQRRPVTATVATPIVLARQPAPTVATSATAPAVAFAFAQPTHEPPREQPAASFPTPTLTPAVITLLVPAPIPMAQSTAAVVAALNNTTFSGKETLNQPSVATIALTTATSTPTNVPVTHLAASQPGADEATVPMPTVTAIALWTPPMTATPTATWTPSPTPTSTAPATVLSESQEAQPNAIAVTVTVTVTAIATVPSLVLAPLFPTASPGSTSGPLLTATPLPSPSATATPTIAPTPTLLPAISGLTAQAAEDKVVLVWEPAVGSIVGYNLYRSASMAGSPGERRNGAPLANATHVDTVVLDGRNYFYYVTVVDQQNRESLPSSVVAVTVADRTPPHTPNLLSLHLSGNQLQLRWQANSEADLAGYRLYRSTNWPVDRAQGPIHGATLLTTPGYLDQVELNGETYYYVFTAVDQAGNESHPSIDAQMPTIDLAAPATPVGLTATVQQGRVELRWLANSEPDLAGYRLYRSDTLPVDITAQPVHDQPLLTALIYHDQAVAEGKTYYYVIVAVDGNQNSSPPSTLVTGKVEG